MKRSLLFHPLFILSLLLLLLNDCWFKQAFANQLTGKLSDFSGLIVFCFFTAWIIPVSKKWIAIVTGLLFIIWKTPLASPFIEWLNQSMPVTIQRVIDYSDYWALLILPLAHTIINRETATVLHNNYIVWVCKAGVSLLAIFAICATSVPPRIEIPKGTIYIGQEYFIQRSKNETIEMIRSLGYNVDYYENLNDSISLKKYHTRKIPYYQTDSVVVYDDGSNPIDTILNVKFTLQETKENRTKIEIINVTLSQDGNIQRWQTLKYLRKQYKRMLEKQVIKKIKQ